MNLIDEQPCSARPPPTGEGWADLYDRHGVEVYRYVFGRCGDRERAEDITQDTFVTAMRTGGHPGEVSVGWLVRVARNRLIDLIRRETRYEAKLQLLGGQDDSEDESELAVEAMQVRAAMKALSVEHRLVLILHYVDGFTAPALADELGRSVRAVESLVRRARHNLVRELEQADA